MQAPSILLGRGLLLHSREGQWSVSPLALGVNRGLLCQTVERALSCTRMYYVGHFTIRTTEGSLHAPFFAVRHAVKITSSTLEIHKQMNAKEYANIASEEVRKIVSQQIAVTFLHLRFGEDMTSFTVDEFALRERDDSATHGVPAQVGGDESRVWILPEEERREQTER